MVPSANGKAQDDQGHGRQDKALASEYQQAEKRTAQAGEGRAVILRFLPLVDEHDDKQRRHDELDACRVKMDNITQKGSHGRARDPVHLIQKRHKEHEPSPVHIRRRRHGTVDRKGLIAHPIDQIGFFPARILILFQHGDPVEQMPRIDHQRQKKGMQRMKGGQQQLHGDKFHRTGKDKQAHEHGKDKGKALAPHEKAIGHPQKEKSDADGDRMRQGSFECFCFHGYSFLLIRSKGLCGKILQTFCGSIRTVTKKETGAFAPVSSSRIQSISY